MKLRIPSHTCIWQYTTGIIPSNWVFTINPPKTDATIHYKSNHPIQHKLAAYRYHINRMLTVSITESAKNQEWNWICTMTKNNGFPLHIIRRIKNNFLSPNPL
jgi:hypothetical protein